MLFRTRVIAALGAVLFALPTLAGSTITIQDAYARAASPVARAGGAFMVILNTGDTDDRLIAVETDVAKRAELHTNIEGEGGVMQMRPVEDGFPVPAGGEHVLARGGDHIMLMGLTRPLNDGDTITLTLIFEEAGEVTVDVPVDLHR